jgi:hypothetical protein
VKGNIVWLVAPIYAEFSETTDVSFIVSKGTEHLGCLVSWSFLGICVMHIEVVTVASEVMGCVLGFDPGIIAIKIIAVCVGDATS